MVERRCYERRLWTIGWEISARLDGVLGEVRGGDVATGYPPDRAILGGWVSPVWA